MRTPRNLSNLILSTVTTGVEPACTHADNVVGLPLPYMTLVSSLIYYRVPTRETKTF